jgi:hypothetical protein
MDNLLRLTDKQLEERFGESQKAGGGRWMPSDYLAELSRRAQDRLSQWLVIATAANALAIVLEICLRQFWPR